eukprot:CAMPEP_0172324076 /NCGR_PEP_ID=MMETSP1058-20130122/50375_1 /TAXON_ID=83371 /ORGANISM="Detonula confervacea, Strain CCMP 353" /LENGTH=88 /DNA_ID=CAMNT_0013040251 /DNA_START=12 /DNA_END=275 /DNA_ORIENTATION=-
MPYSQNKDNLNLNLDLDLEEGLPISPPATPNGLHSPASAMQTDSSPAAVSSPATNDTIGKYYDAASKQPMAATAAAVATTMAMAMGPD